MTVKSSLFSLSFALVVLITAASVAQAQGQGGGRRGGGFGRGVTSFMLLQSEPVQKELELTDDQKTSATKLADEYRPGGGGGGGANMSPEERQKRREELQKKVNDILTPQQQQRLDEIALQVSIKMVPTVALSDSKVAEKLQLTEDQKQQLTDLTSEYRQKYMDQAQGGGPPDRDAMTKLRTEQSDKAMAVLTPDQKDQLTKLQGKMLDVDTAQLMRGFGRRNRAGGGNGGGGNDGGGKDGSGNGGNSGNKAQPDP